MSSPIPTTDNRAGESRGRQSTSTHRSISCNMMRMIVLIACLFGIASGFKLAPVNRIVASHVQMTAGKVSLPKVLTAAAMAASCMSLPAFAVEGKSLLKWLLFVYGSFHSVSLQKIIHFSKRSSVVEGSSSTAALVAISHNHSIQLKFFFPPH